MFTFKIIAGAPSSVEVDDNLWQLYYKRRLIALTKEDSCVSFDVLNSLYRRDFRAQLEQFMQIFFQIFFLFHPGFVET